MVLVKILSGDDLNSIVEPRDLITALEKCFIKYSEGKTKVPSRTVMWVNGNWWGVMPSHVPGSGVGVKVVSVIPSNRDRELPTIPGVVILFDDETGVPKAVMDGAVLTGLRTAATSAISVKYLKPRDGGVVTVIGAGYQAMYHLWFIGSVFGIEKLKIYDLIRGNAEKLRDYAIDKGIPDVEIVDGLEKAMYGADIVMETSTTTTPVIKKRGLKERVHIVSIGAHTRESRAIEDEVLITSTLIVVDSKEATFNETGDIYDPLSKRLIREDKVVELGRFLKNIDLYRNINGITVYKSVGLAIQDACAAAYAYYRSEEMKVGKLVEL
jgi:ornithine cyclodeaminase/alanine dehydrogenase-like protein (mu-crystallin family)